MFARLSDRGHGARWLLILAATSVAGPKPARSEEGNTKSAPATSANGPRGSATGRLWSENFRQTLDWRDPQDHPPRLLARVYSVTSDGGDSFLHAHHDATAKGAPPALHLGKTFAGIRLTEVHRLRWRWRARIQPLVQDDPWLDMAVSLYVVTKAPSFFRKGRGFKFGWLARPGPAQTFQRGLLQVPLRSDPPSAEWRTEEVDLCALYRQTFGSCEGEQIMYIGVVTDADGTKSVAEGDYADVELIGKR